MVQYSYFNRDFSWLSFNYRVLLEAKDASLPLYERIKFLAIYSNNLEEFYQVRVSYYRQLLENEILDEKYRDLNPAAILKEINSIVGQHQAEFHELFKKEIIPELRKNGIYLLEKGETITTDQKNFIEHIFDSEVLSTIQPVLLIKNRIYPFLKSGQVYLALEMYNKDSKFKAFNKRRRKYGIIKLPTDHNIPRFVELPKVDGKYPIMFLDDIIMHFIHKIFPGYLVRSWHSIKLTRDADLDYDEFEGENLIKAISGIKASRSLGAPNRFLYFRDMPSKMLDYLTKTLHIDPTITVKGGTHHNFRDFFVFPNPFTPKLEEPKLPRIQIPDLVNSTSISAAVDKKDYLLSVPYQTYDHFIQFLKQAAQDITVSEIKATQYRVASHSEVVDALMLAADNGKKVTVFVELKARFDEEANLNYSQEMKKAGIKIIYSIPYLKVHAKLALIIRKSGSELKSQAFMGTGNFNEKTARLYGDHGLFTSHEGIVTDIINLFNHLEDQNKKMNFKHILVPRNNMVERFEQLIMNEIKHVEEGRKGYILLKMNGLQDSRMVNKLYEASMKGVKIDLIVRGVCILKTGQSFSKNIRVIRIIDRFLEHARIFVFNNSDDPVIYLGSADWMNRNLYRRIECDFPLYNKDLRNELLDILNIQLNDNVKACLIDENMENVRIINDKPKVRSQIATYEYFQSKYQNLG